MTLSRSKRAALARSGWAVGSAAEFLDLDSVEAAFVELKLALADELRRRRASGRITQGALAQRVGSSQSRVAKIEAADPTVSLDLLVRALLALGTSRRALGRVVASPRNPRAA